MKRNFRLIYDYLKKQFGVLTLNCASLKHHKFLDWYLSSSAIVCRWPSSTLYQGFI